MTLGTVKEVEKEWMIAGQSHKNQMVDSTTVTISWFREGTLLWQSGYGLYYVLIDSLGGTDRDPNIYPFSLTKLKQ